MMLFRITETKTGGFITPGKSTEASHDGTGLGKEQTWHVLEWDAVFSTDQGHESPPPLARDAYFCAGGNCRRTHRTIQTFT
jgi:hypothetical protein